MITGPHFLVEKLPAVGDWRLDGAEGHHAATVQRLRVGEALVLCDGVGGRAPATVTATARGSLDLAVREHAYEPAPPVRISVVQGIAKGDRGELAVQAMTELGVDAVVPWAAARSVVRWTSERPRQRWIDTVREAAKQSRRAWVPPVAEARFTPSVAASFEGTHTLVLHESATRPLSTVELPALGDIAVVVGPEGGITPDELLAFEMMGAIPVRLGPTILRTSTAGPAALAVLSTRLGRW